MAFIADGQLPASRCASCKVSYVPLTLICSARRHPSQLSAFQEGGGNSRSFPAASCDGVHFNRFFRASAVSPGGAGPFFGLLKDEDEEEEEDEEDAEEEEEEEEEEEAEIWGIPPDTLTAFAKVRNLSFLAFSSRARPFASLRH